MKPAGTKLFRVTAQHIVYVEAMDASEAETAAADDIDDWIRSGGVEADFVDAVEIKSEEDMHESWVHALPYRGWDQRNEPERTCIEVLRASQKKPEACK